MLNILPNEQESPMLPDMPKYSEHEPKEYLLNIAKRLQKENESERARINAQTIIQMCRRHRNMTPGDAFGYFKNSVWCEIPEFATLHNVPIFQQLVVGAESNFAQADIRLDVKANTQEFKNRSVEKIAKDIYTILDEKQWTESVRAEAFYAAILKNNAFYISRFNKDKGDDVPVPKFDQVKYQTGGMQQCTQCYKANEMDADTCECGNDSFTMYEEPQTVEDQLVSQFELVKTGEAELVIKDGLDVSMDPNGKPADIKSCQWIVIRGTLVQKAELKRLYPHLKLEGAPKWSYQTRLKMGLIRFQNGEVGPTTESDKTLYEPIQHYLRLNEYQDYCAPSQFKLGNKVILERGETFKDKYPKGMVFEVVNENEVCFVDGEDIRVSSSLWISDGLSPEGLGAKAGLGPCRSANMLVNLGMEGESRALTGALIYYPEVIDGNHLEGANTNIPTKPDFALNGRPLSDFIHPVKVSGLTQETLALLELMKQHAQEAMGIPDVMIGQDTSTDKTFGGQALRSRNALGLLTPKTQSTARAKELWLAHQLDIIQQFYSPEALRQFGARSGNEWQDDEIQAFFDADFDKAITISYIEGTEIPESRFDKQMRLRQDVAAMLIPLTPELQHQFAKESNYDAPDVNNYESNLRLAEKRYRVVSEAINPEMDQAYQQTQMMIAGVVDPQTGQPVPNTIIMQALNNPMLQVYPEVENHDQMMAFWGQKVREMAASVNASPLLLAMCDAMVQKHKGVAVNVGMEQQQIEGMAEAARGAPSAIGQKMLEAQTAEKQPQGAKA